LTTKKKLIAGAALALAAAGCRERPAPSPSPTAAREAPPIRPLTSRDDAAPAREAVQGEIQLDARVRDKARPGDVLYVIARNSSNRQVVAVRKEEGARFPFAFRLSSGDAMMPGTPFEGPFDLTARLSRSGDAIPGAGDLEGTAKNIAAGARDVTLIIDTIRR